MQLHSLSLSHIIRLNARICPVCKYKGKRSTKKKKGKIKGREHKEKNGKESKPSFSECDLSKW